MITLIIFDRRRKGTTHEDYVRHHEEHHARLFTSQPEVRQHVRRYVQKHPTGEAPPGGPDHGAEFDGVTEISFDDIDGLNAVFGSDNYRNNVVPDEERFLDRENVRMLVVHENAVIG